MYGAAHGAWMSESRRRLTGELTADEESVFRLVRISAQGDLGSSEGEDLSPFTSFDSNRLDDRRTTYRRGPDQLESRGSEQLHELLLGSLPPVLCRQHV